MSIKVEIKSVKQALKALSIKSDALVRIAVNATSLELESESKKLAPVDTGNLRSSIKSQNKEQGLISEVGSKVKYAKKVHDTHPTQPNFLTDPLIDAERRLLKRLDKLVWEIATKKYVQNTI